MGCLMTGVRHGCLLSPFMCMLAIDWIIKTTTKIEEIDPLGPAG